MMTLSATALEFVPGRYWNGLQNEPEYDYIVELNDILYQLSINPGLFQECMNSLTDILSVSIREDWQLSEVADVIFEQSIMEPNFTYTGARMIDHLFKTLPVQPGGRNIRTLINERAKEIVVRKEEMALDPAQHKRLHGVTMFMAELFMNMEIIGGDGTIHKVKVYRVALQELFQSLTDHPSEANLKCLCNIFKLAGKTIEDYDREMSNSQSSELINKIFNDGRNYIVNGEVDRSIREQWLRLIEFRASDWGRRSINGQRSKYEEPIGAVAMNGAAGGDVFTNIPTFYSSKGTVISAEEAGFNAELFNPEDYSYEEETDPNNLNFDPALDHYGWQPELGDGSGVTSDMADAYEAFLRETGQEDQSGLTWGLE
nr:polyadenylate-binding protein-interacting protein 1-like [Lytechinus pictus]